MESSLRGELFYLNNFSGVFFKSVSLVEEEFFVDGIGFVFGFSDFDTMEATSPLFTALI